MQRAQDICAILAERTENKLETNIIFNESAFRHGISEVDIRSALSTFIFDGTSNEKEDTFLAIGFAASLNLIEVIYSIIDDNTIQVFHAMKCRKEYLKYVGR